MIPILSISASVFLSTFFDSIWPPIFFAGGVGIIFLVVSIFSKKRKKVLRTGILVLAIFCLSLFSVVFRNDRYKIQQHSLKDFYIGTGSIVDRRGNGAYIFEDGEQRSYLYYSRNTYELGTELFVSASVVPGTGGQNLWLAPRFASVGSKLDTFTQEKRSFDLPKRMLMHGRVGTMHEKRADKIKGGHSDIWRDMRRKTASLLAKGYDKRTFALTVGMLIGDRSYLSKEDYQGFVDSGLVHIIAVSGGNIVLIVTFLSFTLFFLPYYLRLAITLMVVIWYAVVCGMDSSVMRAMIMAMLSIIALFAGRMLSVWRSITYTFVAMLLWNPYYLIYDLGFIFSFTALVGLVYFAQRWSFSVEKKITWNGIMKRFWNNYILPSISASIGISLPLLFFTSRVVIVSILSNIIIIPLVPLVMIYGFFAAVIYTLSSWESLLIPQKVMVGRVYSLSDRTNNNTVTLVSTSGYIKIVILCGVVVGLFFYIIYRNKITIKK